MFSKMNKNSEGVFTSILAAHAILFLHLLLFAVLGVLVVFLSGVMHYMVWILLGGMAIVGLSAYLFYRRLRKEGKSLKEALRSPVFQGRQVEVSLLGGMATLKLDQRPSRMDKAIASERHPAPLQLEDPETARIREINELARLLEKELITRDEFNKAKQRLLG